MNNTMAASEHQIFLSYSGDDACEASLLQFALESLLADRGVRVWTYQRDQGGDTRSVNASLKEQIRVSRATVFLASPSTIKGGAVQWMELAYADAFKIPTFVLLHRITFAKLRTKERGVPPFLVEGQCTPSTNWRHIIDDLRHCLGDVNLEVDYAA